MKDSKRNPTFEQTDLEAVIADEIAKAKAYFSTEIEGRRSLALEYMQGKMRDLSTLPNRSKQMSRDVADTIAWVLPGIVRVFMASSAMVQYSACRAGGEQWARDATEFMNYDFMRNDGYRIVYNATYDALTLSDAVVSSEWIPPTLETETLKSVSAEQIAMLMEAEGIEIKTQRETGEFEQIDAIDEMGNQITIEQPLYDIKISRVTKPGYIGDETLKPENLFVNDNATTVKSARFVGYMYDDKTRSDLMEMADYYNFDKSVIEELPADGFGEDDEVNQSRYLDVAVNNESPVKSGDPINLYRCFPRIDVDGDGIAETVEVWYAGKRVLAWNVWEDDVPYTTIPCYPVPHRFDSESVADRTMDIQRVKTVLLRQALDNIYASNVPYQEVEVGSVLNPDALVHKRFGSILWKKVGSAPIAYGAVPFTADKVFSAMQYQDEIIAKRTGVSRTTMALDPESLQNQTATVGQLQHDAAYSQIELIARNMAELGWKEFFRKRLKLAKKYQQITDIPAPKEDSKFRSVNPSEWDEEMPVLINVGLGTGSRDRDMSMLNVLMNTQTAMAAKLSQVPGAQQKSIEFIPKIMNTAIKLAESSGLKDPDSYFPVINDEDVAQWIQASQQPQVPIEIQLEQAKAQTQTAIEAARVQANQSMKETDAQASVVREKAQLEADLMTKQADRETNMQMETLKQQYDIAKLERDDAFRYAQLAQQREIEAAKLDVQVTLERERMMLSVQQSQEKQENEAKPSDKPSAPPSKAPTAPAQDKAVADALNALAKATAAPKRIIKDADGKPIGVETVMK